MKVRGSDGSNLGKVVAAGEETFLIEKGFFFPKDYTVRYDFVSDVRDGEIWLNRSGEELKGLEELPTKGEERQMGAARYEETRIPLSEEELIAQKTARTAGEVKVHKEVKTEQRQVSVPVTKEEVVVERVPASGQAPGPASFKEETVTVPITEEEVEIKKRPVVREEIRVTKQSHEEERRASGEVRKESADIDSEGDIKRR